MTKTLVRNAIRTPDGTLLVSRYRHDYVSHVDKNGKTYMVDGGLDYIRRSANGDEVDECVYLEDGHDKARELLEWGTYGPNGDKPLAYVKIKDMDSSHIEACLKNCLHMSNAYRVTMENELKLRSKPLRN